MKHARTLLLLLAALVVPVIAAADGVPAQSLGPHDALATFGPQAGHVGALWNLFLVVCTSVFVAVLVALAFAIWHRRKAGERVQPDLSSLGRHEAAPYRSVLVGVAASTLLLLWLLVASVRTDRALAGLPLAGAVHLQVTGHQWWWDVRYDGDPTSQIFTTANEIHVPVGRPVLVTLKSDDVIHSLWVPNLAGKHDLIPGRTALMQFRADRPGIYRGQCAEFCGFQHAYMAFEVIAEPPDRFEAWAARQREEARPPADDASARGLQVFQRSTCVMCHTIEGAGANARKGPDLTHVGGRTTLAAGMLANTAEDLRRWIRDPQKIKPGVNMPASTLSDADLAALVAYLESLK